MASTGHKEGPWRRKRQTGTPADCRLLLSTRELRLHHPGLPWYAGQWEQGWGVVALRNQGLSSMPLQWRVFSTLYLGNCHLPRWLEAKESVSHRSEDQPSATIWIGRAWDRCLEVVEAKRGPNKAGLWGKMILPSCSCSRKFPGTFYSGKGST